MKAYVFPGQGSQKKGMGESLFAAYPKLTAIADDVLGYSIETLCVRDPDNLLALGKTDYTQPALYTVSAMTWLKTVAEQGKPDFVAGHSLGEYNALFAAGAFDFETGLKLVQQRGRLMAQAKSGGMAAILGATEDKITQILQQGGFRNISIANYNTTQQIVVSGAKEEIQRAADAFQQAGITYIILNVNGAFHTPFMQDAAREFEIFLDEFRFSSLQIPVIANVTAQPYANSATVKQLLPTQITSPVRWTESIHYLLHQGDMDFTEVGHGHVLSKLIESIKKDAPPIAKTIARQQNQKQNQSQHQQQTPQAPQTSETTPQTINATSLGSHAFKQAYGLKYAYVTGAMVHGIASKELVIAVGNAGMMGFFGTGGLPVHVIEQELLAIAEALQDKPYGMNLLHSPEDLDQEERLVDLYMKYGVKNIEAAAFMQITPALVKYRLTGLQQTADGEIVSRHKIMAKVSRPEVAEAFFSPAPQRIMQRLLDQGKITQQQATWAEKIPMADALSIEADSGGHTDQGVAYALMPAILRLRADMMRQYGYKNTIFIGAAGGIGTPESAAAAFILGADFVLTGSINQCTVESGASDMAKDMLCHINVQDTDYAPAGDMFEIGAKVQVLRKGVFFPARANKLYALYKQYNSIDEIDAKTKGQIEKLYFKKNFDEVYAETRAYWQKRGDMEQIEKAEKNPKHKMALIFRWYFGYSGRAALEGSEADKVNFQIHTGPALGAFNQWVKGTELEDWRNRYVDQIGIKLITETAALLDTRMRLLINSN